MAAVDERNNLRHLGDMEVEAVAEFGRKRMKLAEARRLRRGDIIELDKLAGESFSLQINGAPFAEGEIVVVREIMACRLTRMVEPPAEEDEVSERADGAPLEDA